MQKNLKKVLVDVGLHQLEAKIYLVLLNTARMTVSDIARSSNIKRPTCYQYIDSLLIKGFILKVPIGRRIFYTAVAPTKVLQEVKKRYSKFEKSVQYLEKQYEENIQKPKVIFYEGKNNIKNIYKETFESVGDIKSIFPAQEFFKNFTVEEYHEFDKLIGGYKFKSKDLMMDDNYFKVVNNIRRKNGLDNKITKKLPTSFQNKVDVLIYENKVALISLGDLSAVVIEHKNIAELFNSMHNTLWNVSKRIS